MMQEMFLELEQEVAGLSEHGPAAEQQQLGELGALGSQQEAAELLSKLELLKANLVSVQQLLQDRQDEERSVTHQQVRAGIIKIFHCGRTEASNKISDSALVLMRTMIKRVCFSLRGRALSQSATWCPR